MRYLIDGHNLIGQSGDISLSDPDDETKLILRLKGFCAGTKHTCTVVFDNGMPGGWSPVSNGVVEVVFAGRHTNADRILIERIRGAERPSEYVVVSTDREVRDAAQARKMRVVRSDEFARQLNALQKQSAKARSSRHNVDEGDEKHALLSDRDIEELRRIFETKRFK